MVMTKLGLCRPAAQGRRHRGAALLKLSEESGKALLPGSVHSMTTSISLAIVLALVLHAQASRADSRPQSALTMALQYGADQAASCQEQVEHDADELPGCVQARAHSAGGTPRRLAEAQRLGALFRGWVIADIAAAYAVDGAEPAATALLHELLPLQRKLGVTDDALCGLLHDGCSGLIKRKREVARSAAFRLGTASGAGRR